MSRQFVATDVLERQIVDVGTGIIVEINAILYTTNAVRAELYCTVI